MCTFSRPVSSCACVCRGERQRKVFLIASQVRGSGSSITHDQVRVVFGELLAGYLSWLSIPLLGLGLCVGMIRSWRLGAGARRVGGRETRGGEVINVDASAGPPPRAPSPASVITPGERRNGPTCSPGSLSRTWFFPMIPLCQQSCHCAPISPLLMGLYVKHRY